MKPKLWILFIFLNNFLWAQSQSNIDLSQGSIKNKFETIYNKSGNYKEYKVVKQYLLRQLKKQVLDTLQAQKTAYRDAQKNILDLQQKINDLNEQLHKNQNKINDLESQKDQISFVGMSVNKTKYQWLVWSIIVFLILGLGYFVFMFKNSIQATKLARYNLDKLEEEYNLFRTGALEREQLLKRQLLDEQKKHQA